MTEISRVWAGTTTGDAGTYTDEHWRAIWASLFSKNQSNKGVLRGLRSELLVAGTSSPVTVASGTAIVKGGWYDSDASTNVAIPTPSGATRIDLIVLRVSWSAQTIRITRVAGSEGGADPALTQTAGTTWDIPIAQCSITTGGVITVTDKREFAGFAGDPFSLLASPTSISANQNDYAGDIAADSWRLTSNGNYNITGIANGKDNRFIFVTNIGSYAFTFVNGSGSSVAINRFDIGQDYVLKSKCSCVLWYDKTSLVWRIVREDLPLHCLLRHTAVQSIADDLATALTFDTEIFDVGAFHDSGTPTRLTIPVTGLYFIHANCLMASGLGGAVETSIRLDGTTYIAYGGVFSTTLISPHVSDGTSMPSSCYYYMVAGQYVEAMVYITDGARNTVVLSPVMPNFGIVKVG